MKEGSIFSAKLDGFYVLKFVGDVRLTLCATLDHHIENVLQKSAIDRIVVDLTDVDGLDSTTLGLIGKIAVRAAGLSIVKPTIVSTNEDITPLLIRMGFASHFIILDSLPGTIEELKLLPMVTESEENVRACIIDAHRILMDLHDDNKALFKDLVLALETNR